MKFISATLLFVPAICGASESPESQNAKELMDILWLAVSAALVFLMQAGFCFLETGSIRKKNTLNVAIKNVSDMMIAVLGYAFIGYALMYGSSYGGYIGWSFFGLSGVDEPYDIIYFLFQAMFAGTIATIVSGAVAERMKFSGYLWVALICATVIYPIAGHWIWNSDGWLAQMGFIDFAGSTAVHSVGAWVALAGVIVLGPRLGRFNKDGSVNEIYGHDLLLTAIGVFILWFGWFGFNGGSLLEASDQIPLVLMNTVVAACAGGIANLMLANMTTDQIRVERILNGVLGGLVGITASAHLADFSSALIIGAVGGLVAHYAHEFLLRVLKLDDPVSAIPVHGFAGVWGTFAVVFVADDVSFGAQLTGILVVFVWSFSAGWILFTLLKLLGLLRVSEIHEKEGLNVTEHGAKSVLLDTMQAMHAIVKTGDLSRPVPEETGTEAGEVAASFNYLINAFSAKIEEMKKASAKMKSTAEHLLEFSDDALKSSDEQSKHAVEITGAVTMLRDKLSEIVQQSDSVNETSRQAETEMGSTSQVITMASDAIESMHTVIHQISEIMPTLSAYSQEVSKATGFIGEITEQTNLLALNAAIEAARAGDSGRGFAVVADEVRNLAIKTKASTEEISGSITRLQNETDKAVEIIANGKAKAEQSIQSVQFAGMAFTSIREVIGSLKDMNMLLNQTINSQKDAAELIQQNVATVERISQSNKSSIAELVQQGREMDAVTGHMDELVGTYKIH